jgi:hypothetical protein
VDDFHWNPEQILASTVRFGHSLLKHFFNCKNWSVYLTKKLVFLTKKLVCPACIDAFSVYFLDVYAPAKLAINFSAENGNGKATLSSIMVMQFVGKVVLELKLARELNKSSKRIKQEQAFAL